MGYNGHKNWEYWNVALWIGNEEWIYKRARELYRRDKKTAVQMLMDELPTHTPDGAQYTEKNVRAALRGIL